MKLKVVTAVALLNISSAYSQDIPQTASSAAGPFVKINPESAPLGYKSPFDREPGGMQIIRPEDRISAPKSEIVEAPKPPVMKPVAPMMKPVVPPTVPVLTTPPIETKMISDAPNIKILTAAPPKIPRIERADIQKFTPVLDSVESLTIAPAIDTTPVKNPITIESSSRALPVGPQEKSVMSTWSKSFSKVSTLLTFHESWWSIGFGLLAVLSILFGFGWAVIIYNARYGDPALRASWFRTV